MNETLSKDREHYVLDNLKLIHKVLKMMNVSSKNYEEYYSAGCLGLTVAAIRYDESLGYEFSSYAIPYIKGYVIQDMNTFVDPRGVSRQAREYQIKYDKYKNSHPLMSESEIHDALGLSPYYRKVVGDRRYSVVSLDEMSVNYDVVEDPDSTKYVDDIMDKEVADQILLSIKKITRRRDPRSQAIYEEYITRRADGDHVTHEELANKYGVSRQRVHQLITSMNDKVKSEIGGNT